MEKPVLKLEASAGSGKTYRLALEYLSRLLRTFSGPNKKARDPRQQRESLGSILAITFTVKAAREMKERIVEKLKRFALSSGGQELGKADMEFLAQLVGDTGLDQGKIIQLSGELIELVLASYDDFNVMTIDSLMSAMVKVIAPDLDLPADYEIAVDARDELESRARGLLAGLADSDWPRLERFLEEFRRWNAQVTWKADAVIADKVTSLFRRMLRQGDAGAGLAPDRLRIKMAASWKNFQSHLRPLLPILQAREPGGKGRRYASGTHLKDTMLDRIGEALECGADASAAEEFLKSKFFRQEDPEALLLQCTPDDHRQRFAAAYRAAQEALRSLILDFSVVKTLPYREFLGNFSDKWQEDKKILFVEEFSYALAGLFSRWLTEAFPYIYLKLSDRFNNFLFDEFQDTSTLQFKALAPLIDEVLSRERKASLFIVGDRKQAIYRWRGGNSELMEERLLREEIPSIVNRNPGGFSHTLGWNWRSRKEIIGFNNDFWDPETISRIAAEAELQQAIAKNFSGSRQESPASGENSGGYVELSLKIEAEQEGEECAEEAKAGEEDGEALSPWHLDRIEAIIARLREHGYKHSDIAVLVRKNDQVRSVIRRLGRKKIASVSDQSLLLGANPRVNEIIAFLSFLDYPPDDLGFFSFISGGIFRAAAAARFPAEMKDFSEEVFIGGSGPFYKLFQEKFPGSWQGLVEPFFQAVGFLPPYDLFCDITQTYRVYENFPGDTPFIMALGDALHRAERNGGNSIAGFLRQWKKMVADEETPAVTIPENAPGVRVLTMHQSKGLEFPAVIVPLNDRGGRSDDNLHWDEEGLFYINGEFAQAHPGLKDKYQKENIRGSIDLLNLLYVSFTRAREALFVPVAVHKGIKAPAAAKDGLIKKIARSSDAVGGHPLLAWFAEEREPEVRRGRLEPKESKPLLETRQSPIPSKKVLTRSWQARYLVFKKSDAAGRRDGPAAARGDRIHDLLSRLGAITDPGELDARVREMAAETGWPGEDAETVARFLCRDDVLSLLRRGEEFQAEKEIVQNAGDFPELLRLDRLQVGPEEVLVIDFKTGKEKSADHEKQMEKYLAAAAPLFPGKKCCGWLLYIDRGEIEEVPCSN